MDNWQLQQTMQKKTKKTKKKKKKMAAVLLLLLLLMTSCKYLKMKKTNGGRWLMKIGLAVDASSFVVAYSNAAVEFYRRPCRLETKFSVWQKKSKTKTRLKKECVAAAAFASCAASYQHSMASSSDKDEEVLLPLH